MVCAEPDKMMHTVLLGTGPEVGQEKIMAWMWLLVLVLVIVAIVVKLRRNSRIFIIRHNPFESARQEQPQADIYQPPLFSENRHSSGEVEHMVCCEYCEVYVPVSEAVERSGKIFCCHEHGVAYFSEKRSS